MISFAMITVILITMLYHWSPSTAQSSEGICPNNCNSRGTCGDYGKCTCFNNLAGLPAYRGYDCSLFVCPYGVAWMSEESYKANDMRPLAECSNQGTCETSTGLCKCNSGFEGMACERSSCLYDCNDHGICYTEKQLADNVGRVYSTPWDAEKFVGCLCDKGYRGLDCSKLECKSFPDVLKGPGNAQGRECSGRGICNYGTGACQCFEGYTGQGCEKMSVKKFVA